jgi:hypothetical protein
MPRRLRIFYRSGGGSQLRKVVNWYPLLLGKRPNINTDNICCGSTYGTSIYLIIIVWPSLQHNVLELTKFHFQPDIVQECCKEMGSQEHSYNLIIFPTDLIQRTGLQIRCCSLPASEGQTHHWEPKTKILQINVNNIDDSQTISK